MGVSVITGVAVMALGSLSPPPEQAVSARINNKKLTILIVIPNFSLYSFFMINLALCYLKTPGTQAKSYHNQYLFEEKSSRDDHLPQVR